MIVVLERSCGTIQIHRQLIVCPVVKQLPVANLAPDGFRWNLGYCFTSANSEYAAITYCFSCVTPPFFFIQLFERLYFSNFVSEKRNHFPCGKAVSFCQRCVICPIRSKTPLRTEPHKASPKASCCRTASLRSHRQSNRSPTAGEHPLLSRRSNYTSPTAIPPAASNTLPPTRRTSCTTCRTGNFPAPQRWSRSNCTNEDIVVAGKAESSLGGGNDSGDDGDDGDDTDSLSLNSNERFFMKSKRVKTADYSDLSQRLYLTEKYELSWGEQIVNALRKFVGLPEEFVEENNFSLNIVAEYDEVEEDLPLDEEELIDDGSTRSSPRWSRSCLTT